MFYFFTSNQGPSEPSLINIEPAANEIIVVAHITKTPKTERDSKVIDNEKNDIRVIAIQPIPDNANHALSVTRRYPNFNALFCFSMIKPSPSSYINLMLLCAISNPFARAALGGPVWD
jgi:hypothetical protein